MKKLDLLCTNFGVGILAGCLSIVIAGSANAADPGAYVGAGAGFSTLGSFSNAQTIDDGGLGGRVFFGYNFNENFGIESNFSSMSKTKYQLDEDQNLTFNDKINVFSFVGKMYVPLAKKSPVNLYLSLGVVQVYGDLEAQYYSIPIPIRNHTSSAFNAAAGLGVSYDVSQHIMASLDASSFGGESGDETHISTPRSGLVTFNIAYKF